MPKYDGWEPLLDDRNPPREKTLGSGGQGIVYLARSPEGVRQRRDLEKRTREMLVQVGGGRWDTAELAKCLFELGGTTPAASLGALTHFKIPPDNKDEESKAIGRLESEVKALQALQDEPGVLKLLHSNVAGRFIVTEYHPRGTLDKHLQMFKGNPLAALEAFAPLVSAVARIHEQDAIHRDIKPENIFLTTSGNLVLGDFGIVLFQEGSDRLTATYERVGSHYWMAPWVYRNRRLELSEINSTLDIYPLAKVLWSMIAGQNGFPNWEYKRDENDLEKIFPEDPVMSLINEKIFSKSIVREPHDCRSSARLLLSDVDRVITHINALRGYKPADVTAWPCRICGKGKYQTNGSRHQLNGYREGGPSNLQQATFNASVCDHCGHVELFTR